MSVSLHQLWLAVQHVVFGKLLEGQELLKKIEDQAGSKSGEPEATVIIQDCGELPVADTSEEAAAAET